MSSGSVQTGTTGKLVGLFCHKEINGMKWCGCEEMGREIEKERERERERNGQWTRLPPRFKSMIIFTLFSLVYFCKRTSDRIIT